MRRLVALLVVALLGATAYGIASGSSAIAVNGAKVSDSSFAGELKAISTIPTLQCFMEALGGQSFAAGAGSPSVTGASSAEWANLRVEGLAIADYVKKNLHYTPSANDLAAATTSFEGEMTSAASSAGYNCPGTSSEALADMPAEMRSAEIADQADSTYYVSRLDGTIPVTLSSLKTYYDSHVALYDTICVSIAVVSPANLKAFSAAQAKGESVAELAKQYSADASGAKGGAYGCYAPGNSSFASVRNDVATTALDTFPKNYQVINYNGTEAALFVAPTKRTVSSFASAASAVLADIQTINSSNAKTHEETVLYEAAVSIDPAFGQWGLSSTGPSVFANSLPSASDVNAAKLLTSVNASTYK